MSYKFIVALEHKQAFFTLVVQSRRSLKPIRAPFLHARRRFYWGLVLVHFTCFLASILKPYNYDSWAETEEF